ncbi:MAG: GntR family transcriptional regulator [Lactobacillus sp.]|jgi:GntR family transcriptional regulator|nr:GntR family transcriptional regulator [Lactobacillus sp.]MCI2032340.1 GntR family transcriptional regulator [Lactobacillus sp.]
MSTSDLSIQFDPAAPIYAQIADTIKKKIAMKEWRAGHRLPSEEDLVQTLGVARGTVRKAISTLVEDGTLERIQGKGTYVAEDKISYPFAQELTSYAESMKDKGLDYSTQVLKCEVEQPTSMIQKRLDVPASGKVLRLERLRTVDGVPAILLYNWVNLLRCPGLEQVDFTQHSLFEAIEQIVGVKIKYGIRNFSARKLTEEQAELMAVNIGDPILNISQVTYNDQEQPIEYSEILLRTDQYQVTSVLYR